MRLNRNPNLFLRFLYLSLMILNLLRLPITFSFTTRSEAIFWFSLFSSWVNGFFLLVFFWKSWIFLKLLYACISAISYSTTIACPTYFALLKQLEIVFFTVPKGCANNGLCLLVYNHLTFQCVALLLPWVKILLLIISILDLFFSLLLSFSVVLLEIPMHLQAPPHTPCLF